MKKLLFAVSALAALSLLAPSTGFAHDYDNQLGLYMTADANGLTGTSDVGVPVTVFLVLTRPAKEDGTAWSGITAFDCQLNFEPIGNMFKIGDALNGDGFNIGDAGHIELGFLEYIVGLSAQIEVVDGACLLTTLQFINNNVGEVNVTLSPASVPSIDGALGFVTPDQTLQEMFPSSGNAANPVFTFGGIAVPVEGASFGAVKALYR